MGSPAPPAAPPPPPVYGPQPPPMYAPQPMYMGPKPRSAIPIAGGILLIVSGILGFVLIAMMFYFTGGLFGFLPFIGGVLQTLLIICGIVLAVFSVFALIGGIMAVQRRMWGLALTGGILGLFTVGPFGIASILALIGLILVGVSHDEFT